MFQYPTIKIALVLSIFGQIPLEIKAKYDFSNHVRVSSRLDLSGSLKHLCVNDPDNDNNEVVSCDCLSKLSMSSTVQVGKYQNVFQYSEKNQNAAGSYTSLYQTDKDLGVYGFGRMNLKNVKCVENNEVKELTSKYTHWFHSYQSYSIVSEPNGGYLISVEVDDEYIPMAIKDITSESAPKLSKLQLLINKTEVEYFDSKDKDLGTICGESLKKGSMEHALWSLFDQVTLHNVNNCNFPNGTIFPSTTNKPLIFTIDEPLKCGDYTVQWGAYLGIDFVVSWYGTINFHLEGGGSCV